MKRSANLLFFFFFITLSLPKGLFSQNRKKIDSLIHAVKISANDSVTASAYNNLSSEYSKLHPDSALLFAKKALALCEKKNLKIQKIIAYNRIGSYYYFKGDYPKALEQFRKAWSAAKSDSDSKEAARSLGNIGNVFYAQSNLDSAMHYYEGTLQIGKKISDRSTIADANGNLANIYFSMGKYDKSLDYNLRALSIREEMNDLKKVEFSYNNIGGIYFAMNNYEKALEYIKKALHIQEMAGNKKGMADSYHNLGSICTSTDSLDRALDYFNRSLNLTIELGDKTGTAHAYDNIGTIYFKTKQFAKAIDIHTKVLKVFRETGNRKDEATALNNLGGDMTAMNDFQQAISNLSLALSIGKEIGSKGTVKDTYDFMVQLYQKMGEPKKALAYYELSAAYGDSLLNEESANSIVEMQTKFDTEKKQKEIEILQKDKKLKELALTAGEEKNRSLQTLIYVLLGGVLLTGVLVFLIYRENQQKRKNNELLENRNKELNRQKEITEQKNQLITDSVDYAQTLIDLRLPTENEFSRYFKNVFIKIHAADIISGCMYSLFVAENAVYIAVVDCGIKGIPGAFLALRAQQSFRQVMEDSRERDRQKEIVLADAFSRFKNELENNIGIKDLKATVIECRHKDKKLQVENFRMLISNENSSLSVSNLDEPLHPKINETNSAFQERAVKQMENISINGSDLILTTFWI